MITLYMLTWEACRMVLGTSRKVQELRIWEKGGAVLDVCGNGCRIILASLNEAGPVSSRSLTQPTERAVSRLKKL